MSYRDTEFVIDNVVDGVGSGRTIGVFAAVLLALPGRQKSMPKVGSGVWTRSVSISVASMLTWSWSKPAQDRHRFRGEVDLGKEEASSCWVCASSCCTATPSMRDQPPRPYVTVGTRKGSVCVPRYCVRRSGLSRAGSSAPAYPSGRAAA